MTTILTRLFSDQSAAQSAADRLYFKGIPRRDIKVIAGSENADARMARAEVHETAMGPYGAALAAGHAVLVVRATYKPLGAARIARDVLSKRETIDTGKVMDDFSVPFKPDRAPSVMKDHPHMLSLPGFAPRGHVSAAFGLPLLKQHRTKRSAMSSGKRASRMFWPMPLLKSKSGSKSAIHGGRHMSQMFWPMPLVSTAPRRKSVIPGGGLVFSRLFGLRPLQ
ncbi:MAG: hypothetical protein NWQ23_01665 [Yoonia sp.]|uniref:hypothetical protein n=1 Tax=Yoonia sp. TaxID=2212373 RepID=UPI00273EEBA3|nr:hypothetical protein [Yoonia sp.]MDP5084097.1 hypothetical protein [Yoonia sp.]